MFIAVSNHQVALSLPPLPKGATVAVLIRNGDGDADDATINARALAMRHATHFVYDHDDRSPHTRMFRERLIGLGAVPIELRKSRSQALGITETNAGISSNPMLFANHFAGQ
jgi:hypothetical protein